MWEVHSLFLSTKWMRNSEWKDDTEQFCSESQSMLPHHSISLSCWIFCSAEISQALVCKTSTGSEQSLLAKILVRLLGHDVASRVLKFLLQYSHTFNSSCSLVYAHLLTTGWHNKNGATISLQIFWKFHDRIVWKLVNFCNIICWTQSLTFCLKISSRCGAT